MKTTVILGISGLLASLVAAVPLEKREVVLVTSTEIETVDVTETVTITGTPPSSTSETFTTTTTPAAAGSDYNAAAAAANNVVESPAPVITPSSSSSSSTTEYSTTSSTPVVTPNDYAPLPPSSTSSSTPPPPPPPPPSSTSTTSVAAETSTPPATNNNNYGSTTSSPAGSLTGGKCLPGSACHGELTFWHPALGSCGHTNNDSEDVIAISHAMYGSPPNPNNSPFCGLSVTIKANGVTSKAKVVDRCEGCKYGDIDLSPSLFAKFYPLGAGRKPVEWWFD